MKKLFAVMISAVMMAGALVALTMSPSNAACPYTGCVETFTSIDAPNKVKRGKGAIICGTVTTDGNGRPKGKLFLVVRRSKGDFKFTDVKKYNDREECFATPKLWKLGNYTIKMSFERKPGSGFKDSDATDEFRVVRRG